MAKRLESLKGNVEGIFLYFFYNCDIPNIWVPKTANCIFFMQVSRGNGKDKRKPTFGKWSMFLRAKLLWTSFQCMAYSQAPTGANGFWELETICSSYLTGNITIFFLRKNLKSISNSILTMGSFLLSWTPHPALQILKDLTHFNNKFHFAFTRSPSPLENTSSLPSPLPCLGDWGTGRGLLTDGWDQRALQGSGQLELHCERP